MQHLNKTNLPLVTIMIPTYNQEKFIGEAIESALAQDYPNLEVVVTDDCSKDSTGEIASSYMSDSRLRYIRNQTNLGRVGNYHNTATNIAQGEWIINLDGDDYFTSRTFISDAIKEINRQSSDVVAYCYKHNIKIIENFIPSQRLSEHAIVVSGRDYFLNYYKYGGFGHPSIIYRRDLGLKIGMYLIPWQACDFHSIIREFILGHLILDDRKVAYWRVHGGNATVLESEDKQVQAMKTFDAIEDFAKDYFSPKELKNWRFKMNRSSYRDYVITYGYTHRNLKALGLLIANFKFRHVDFRLLYRQLTGY